LGQRVPFVIYGAYKSSTAGLSGLD